MEIIKLAAVFAVMILLLKFKVSLTAVISSGAVFTAFLYGISLNTFKDVVIFTVTSWETISIIIVCYLVYFLQKMLEKRNDLSNAQKAMSGLFNNRRINACATPIFVGMLASAGTVFIAGEMVDKACEDYMSPGEKTFLTNYFRHLSETFMPTYTSTIIAVTLSGVEMSSFVLTMLPMTFVLIALGYLFYLRKLPKETGFPPSKDKKGDFKLLIKSLWTIIFTIVAITVFEIPVYIAVTCVLVLDFFVNKFSLEEIKPFFKSSIDMKVISSLFVIMVFKNVLTETGVMNRLPEVISTLPLPTYAVFAVLFFAGGIISGANATVALCTPLAFAAMPNGGAPYLMLLMSFSFAAMQMSPTHICLSLAVSYFNTSLMDIVKRALPIMTCSCAIAVVYYNILTALL